MPIYEYRCTRCGYLFSHLTRSIQATEEADYPACPACGDHQVQRLISTFAVRMGRGLAPVGEAEDASASDASKQVFGEKELKQALKDRGY